MIARSEPHRRQRHRATSTASLTAVRISGDGLYLLATNVWATPGRVVHPGNRDISATPPRRRRTIIGARFNLPSIHPHGHRIHRRVRFGRVASIDGIVEMFNVFHHSNYGSFTLSEHREERRPATSRTSPFNRDLQLGFRASF